MSEIVNYSEDPKGEIPADAVKLNKQFDKLKHKAMYLDMEYEEVSEKFKQHKMNFISSMMSFCSENKLTSPFSEPPDKTRNEKEVERKEKKQEKKKFDDLKTNDIFREIVKKTHPDMNRDCENTELYSEAVKAKKKGDFRKIIKVATELNVKIDKVSPQIIKYLREEIQKIEFHIQQMKGDLMYQWGESDESHKKTIIENLGKKLRPY